MAVYHGNTAYLRVNGNDVESLFRDVEFTLNVGDEDTSAGTGIEWESHGSKLKNIGIKLTLIYNTASAPTDISGVLGTANEVVAVVYGPEDNVTGKPKHDQDFKWNSIKGPAQSHDKKLVVWEADGVSTGAPRSNMYAGDTF